MTADVALRTTAEENQLKDESTAQRLDENRQIDGKGIETGRSKVKKRSRRE